MDYTERLEVYADMQAAYLREGGLVESRHLAVFIYMAMVGYIDCLLEEGRIGANERAVLVKWAEKKALDYAPGTGSERQ